MGRHAQDSRRPKRQSFGAAPSAALTILAIALLAGVTEVVGVLNPPLLHTAPADDVKAPSSTPAQALSAAPTPATAAIINILGDGVTWGVQVPTKFGCDVPAAVVSGRVGDTTLHAYPAGMASRALDQLRACGTTTAVNGAAGANISTTGGVVTAWTRGDLLVTVAAPARDADQLAAVDAKVTASLEGVCPELAPSAEDARRNPLAQDYTPFTSTITVSASALPEPTTTSPSEPPLPTPLPTAEPLSLPTLPAGVSGPPLPSPMTAPQAPQDPGPQPTSQTASVPAVDRSGPGCGWAFTGQTPPVADTTAVAAGERTTRAATEAALKVGQQAWLTARQDYLASAPQYLTALTAWNQYVTAVNQVSASWQSQRAALDAFNAAMKQYNDASAARDALLAKQQAARTDYENSVRSCATHGGVDPTSAPTPSPTPSPGVCPPVRPAILDEVAPSGPTQPTPPTLWTAP